jgi:hypothetical protein
VGARLKSSALPPTSILQKNGGLNMDVDTEIYIEEQAEIIARKALEGYRQAIYFDGEHWGQTYDSGELVYDIIDSDDYPSMKIFNAVRDTAETIIDNQGGPWCTEEEYAALTGADEPHEYEDQLEFPF